VFEWVKNYFKRRAYNKYMQSKEWKKLRGLVLKRDGYKCFLCESKEKLEVHKLHNEKNLYNTKMYQCVTLCNGKNKWHKRIHKKAF